MNAFLADLLKVWVALTGSLVLGLLANEFRPVPLPLIYNPPKVRMDQTVEALHEQATPLIPLGGDVSQEEMWKISQNKSALIVDARPNVFYQLSHIPGAVSLPRDDFEAQYKLLGEKLEPYKIKLVIVYCAELDCHDSQMVGDALTKLGFRYVRLYRLGWSDWEQAGLPQEKSE